MFRRSAAISSDVTPQRRVRIRLSQNVESGSGSTSTQTPNQSPTTVVGNSPNAEIQDPMAREQRARYLAETHSQALADAKRLAQLARELEDELDRSDGLTLSASAMKKTDEIAKLAKSVKSKMRTY